MAALASLTDVEDVTGPVPTAEQERVARLLDKVSDRVRRYTGQVFDVVTDDEVTLWPVDGKVRLPQRPVLDVTSVSQGGASLVASSFEWDADGNLWRAALVELNQRARLWACGKLTAVYSHGYVTTPGDVSQLVAEVTADVWRRSTPGLASNVTSHSEALDGYNESTTYAQPLTGRSGWSDDHKAVLDFYRGGTARSTRL